MRFTTPLQAGGAEAFRAAFRRRWQRVGSAADATGGNHLWSLNVDSVRDEQRPQLARQVGELEGVPAEHVDMVTDASGELGETSRLSYQPHRHGTHRGKGRDTFARNDYRDLVVRPHIQFKAPIVLI
jgi:hypothetical protein